ncbi:MAG: hypothetical protein RLZZ400_282, partial [Actinomycetota bacterium]
ILWMEGIEFEPASLVCLTLGAAAPQIPAKAKTKDF